MTEPDFDCYQALRARDPRFDGRFFVGVKTTGVYCRPVCSARTPREASCVFVATAAAAERAGFRPCLRCRPELAPGGAGGPPLAQALFAAIRGRVARGDSVRELAGPTGYSPRQLRRLTMQSFGVTPVEILQTERLLFAKKLLHETRLPMTEVALAVGFRSLRRFNALFSARYRLSPTALRRQGAAPRRASPGGEDVLTLRLAYRPPFAWRPLLAYLARRVVPGVEWVSPERGSYGRTVALGGKSGWVLVTPSVRGNALEVRTPATFADGLWTILARLRSLFDLDANPAYIDEVLAADPLLAPSVHASPGLRVPGAWDPFELAVRAVLGQQVSVAGATTLAGRLAARFGTPLSTSFDALHRLAPTPAALASATVENIAAIGLPRARAGTLRDLAALAARGELEFRPADGIDGAVATLRRVHGIGEWTAQYVAMRALRYPDAFPAADLGLRKALAPVGKTLASEKEVIARRSLAAVARLRRDPSLAVARKENPTVPMTLASYHTTFASPIGRIELRATERGLTGLFMEDHRHGPAPEERAAWTHDDAHFAAARAQLAEYFAGTRTAFDLPLDLDGMGGTAFQQRVWAALCGVPYGETISYGELAGRIGQPSAVRAVGLANGRNPVSIIVPCHRVIGANGTLTGYGGGMTRKRALLDLEARASQQSLL